MIELIIYLLASYVLTFIFYSFVINRKKAKKRPMEMDYLLTKYNIDEKDINTNKLRWTLNIVNPFIVSLTFLVVISIKSFILGIIVGFIVMILLIYSIYEIIGRVLIKIANKKEKVK